MSKINNKSKNMKRKFYLVTSVLLSVGSNVMLQAMQEQQVVSEQSVLTSPAARNKFYYDLITDLIRQNPQEALRILRQALQRGFDVNYRDHNDNTLLGHAILSNNIDLIKALLDAGADPSYIYSTYEGDFIPFLHLAIDENVPNASLIVEALIKAGADVNVTYYGETPLILAVTKQNMPVIQTLLRMPNINLMVQDPQGDTAYDIAKRQGNQEIVRLLAPRYMTLKGKAIEAVKKYRGQEIPREKIEQRLPQELQEELLKQ